MTLSIKYKIRLGTLFLLFLLFLSGGLSIFYQVRLTNASKNILKDNYESLDYCQNMTLQLDSILMHHSGNLFLFDSLLTRQEKNITEKGEREATNDLRAGYTRLRNGDTGILTLTAIRADIHHIIDLNMQAIQRKNRQAGESAENAYTVIVIVLSLCFIIGLSFAFNFPGVVVNPIQKLMEAIAEISAKNYRHRIHLDRNDEFGQLATAFNTMSERLESFENSNLNKLIFEKARAEAVINSLKDASIGIDKNNRILFANQQALILLGLKAEETIGQSVDKLRERNDLLRFLTESDSGSPIKIVVDGKENFYTRETIQVQQDNVASKVIVLKNITSFKEMDTAKTNFIATISHELKTPLAASDFSLKLLEDIRIGSLSPEQKQLVAQLKSDNQRMLRILSELLNLSQIEAGKLQLLVQRTSPYLVVDASLKAIQAGAQEKNIAVVCQMPHDLPDILADPEKASWVLNNYFTNAIRFSEAGMSVLLEVVPEGDFLRFSVIDRGPGIDAAYLSRIFERYFQVPGRNDQKGSGIGLAICKEFMEAMGGWVAVKSQPGEGSNFSFGLPVYKP